MNYHKYYKNHIKKKIMRRAFADIGLGNEFWFRYKNKAKLLIFLYILCGKKDKIKKEMLSLKN